MERKYTAKELTRYAEKIDFRKPKVWYSRMDGWWLESDKIEEYLGVRSSEAKSKLTELCEGALAKFDEIALYEKFLDEFTDKDGLMKPCNPDAIFNWFGWKLWRSKQ